VARIVLLFVYLVCKLHFGAAFGPGASEFIAITHGICRFGFGRLAVGKKENSKVREGGKGGGNRRILQLKWRNAMRIKFKLIVRHL